MVPALKKNSPQAIGKSRGGWTTKIHLVAASDRCAITFRLSPGQDHDAPAGRQRLIDFGPVAEPTPLNMDRAYEGDDTRQLTLDLGNVPVAAPKSNRLDPWEYDRAMYRKRNEVERLFRRTQGISPCLLTL
jgi:transposase